LRPRIAVIFHFILKAKLRKQLEEMRQKEIESEMRRKYEEEFKQKAEKQQEEVERIREQLKKAEIENIKVMSLLENNVK